MSEFVKSKSRIALSPGDSIRIARELMEWTQSELARKCHIPQSTISALESGRVALGVERAKKLARALQVHPSVLLFPQWETASLNKNSGRSA